MVADATAEPKIERFFCTDCGHKTKHFIRGEHSATEHDENEVVSFTQRLLIVECCGCEHLALVKNTHFPEDIEYSYHPVILAAAGGHNGVYFEGLDSSIPDVDLDPHWPQDTFS